MKPLVEPYGNSKTKSHKALRMQIGRLTLWFSYSDVVAFEVGEKFLVVRAATGGRVQEKHLDAIDGGSKAARERRVDPNRFDNLWDRIVEPALSAMTSELHEHQTQIEKLCGSATLADGNGPSNGTPKRGFLAACRTTG